jgi:hypothetical protein
MLHRQLGRRVEVVATTVVVWPSRSDRRLSTFLLGRVGPSPLVGPRSFGWLVRSTTGTRGRLGFRRNRAADPRLVGALAKLLVTPTLSRVDWEAAEAVANRGLTGATLAAGPGRQGRHPAGSPRGGRVAAAGRSESGTVPADDRFGDDAFGEES